MNRKVQSVLLGAVLFAAPTVRAAEPNLQPIVERLGSSASRDRIEAVRDLTRLKPPAAKARPLLEKLLTDSSNEVRGEVVWSIADLLGAQGTDLLEKLYADSDRTVRDSAIRAACKMWDQAKPKALCTRAFGDADYAARVEVLGTLRDSFPKDAGAAELFRKALKDPSPMVQRSGVLGVQSARDAKAVPELARLARSPEEIVSEPAVSEALATIGTPEAVQELIALLPKPKPEGNKPARPNDRIRAAAARALERIKDPKSLPALRAILSDPSPMVRIGAMGAVTEMRDKQSVTLIAGQLADKETRVRQFALRSLRQIGDPSCADAVRKVLHEDKEWEVRSSAVSTLADLLGAKAIPDLAATKDDLTPEVRLEAAGSLAGFGKPAAAALAVFVKDASADVRKVAIQGLGQIGGPENIPAITEAAADTGKPNLQVRVAAAEALGGIKHEDGLPTLTKLAGDAEPSVRQAAAVALGRIGGPKAQKVLEGLLKDQVGAVRNAARKALDNKK